MMFAIRKKKDHTSARIEFQFGLNFSLNNLEKHLIDKFNIQNFMNIVFLKTHNRYIVDL